MLTSHYTDGVLRPKAVEVDVEKGTTVELARCPRCGGQCEPMTAAISTSVNDRDENLGSRLDLHMHCRVCSAEYFIVLFPPEGQALLMVEVVPS